MKTIENKSTTIEAGRNEAGGIEFLNYATLIKSVMQQRKQDGYSVEDMRKDFRVLDAVEPSNGEIKLEDSDFEHLKSKMKTMRWGVANKELIQFEDDITAIK